MDAPGLVARRLLVWCPLYVVAGLLGRLTIIDGVSLALVWPAAGIAVLWLASATRRTLPYDLGALAVLVFGVNASTGAPPSLAGLFVVTNLVQAVVFVLVMRRLRPELYLFGGRAPLGTLRDLAAVVGTAVASAAVGAVLGTTGLGLLGRQAALLELLVWWGRNTAGIVTVGVLGLLLLHRAAQLAGGVSGSWPRPESRRVGEVTALWLLSATVLVSVFGETNGLPIGFLLLTTTVLVGVRLGPLGVATHALATGAGAMVYTLLGRGPFAAIDDLSQRALVAQVFVMMTVLTGLVLTFSRGERDAANAELAALQRETADRARLMGSVLETMQEGLTVVAADGTVLVANGAASRILGQGVADEVLDPENLDQDYGMRHQDGRGLLAHEAPYVRATGGETFQQDYLLTRPGDSAPIVLEVTAGPLPQDQDDSQPQAVITFRDVTSLRHDRDALATFAGVVAHDLKRPLTVIAGWTDALVEELGSGPVEPAAALSMLSRVAGSAEQMRLLLDDLLHYTVVRDAPVRTEPLDLSAAAEDAADTFRGRASSPLVVVQPGMRAVADPVMLRQVLDNLLGNAVKYVPEHRRPRVEVTGRAEAGRVVLGVRDNGIGVPAEARERIFETFHRAHGAEFGGTGLGLAIARRAAERCGGSLVLAETSDDGTLFEVRLPAPVGV